MRFFSKLKSEGTVLALFLLGLCPANLSGQTVVDEFTSANFEATKGTYVSFSDVQGASGAMYAGNTAADYGSIQLRASEKSGIVTTASGGERVRRITVEWNSHTASSSPRALDIYGKRTAYASSGDLYEERVATRGTLIGSIPRGTSAIEIEGDYTYVGLRSADGTIYLDKLDVTWETGEEDRVETPVFSPAGGTNFVDELTVKAACATEGATVYYTLDGTDPTEGSDVFPAEGLTLDRTATVKAMAANGTLANSGIAEATYTRLEPLASLAELKAEAPGEYAVRLDGAVVTYADAGMAYIQDGTAGLHVSGSNSLKAGTRLDGMVLARLELRDGLHVLAVDGGEFSGVEVTEPAALPVQTLTLAELAGNFARYESMMVRVEGATVTSAFNGRNGEIEQEGTAMALRAADDSIQADVQAVVDVTGYPGLYHETLQLNVLTQDAITVVKAGKRAASLSFDQTSYQVNVGGTATVKATTNSTAAVTYASDNPEVATVDAATGEVAALAAGSATITASVPENEEYTGASASCVVTVVDAGAQPAHVAFVAEKKGAFYAMTATPRNNNKLRAQKVFLLDGAVVATPADISRMGWHANPDRGVIQNAEGDYVAYDGGTDIVLRAQTYKWTVADGLWTNGESRPRALGVNGSGDDLYMGAYYVEDASYGKARAVPVTEGYTRQVAAGSYGTLCLPCAVAAGDFAGMELFAIEGKLTEGGMPTTLVLAPAAELEAGVPYIFCATDSVLLAAYKGESADGAGEANGLVGTFSGQPVEAGMYMISSGNKVQLCGEGCSIGANRAYIDMDKVPEVKAAAGAGRRLIPTGGATGMRGVAGGTGNRPVDVYTAGGVKVRAQVRADRATEGLRGGLYVVNGKKVVVKE